MWLVPVVVVVVDQPVQVALEAVKAGVQQPVRHVPAAPAARAVVPAVPRVVTVVPVHVDMRVNPPVP